MRSIDISKLAEDNHRYAFHLAALQGVIVYHNGAYQMADTHHCCAFEAIDFWRNTCLSAEILLKACLLKHQVNFFKKRAHSEYGEEVTAVSNPWLNGQLKKLEINYIAQINTGTINTTLKYAENQLFTKLALPTEKAELISEMFYIIIRTRRNRNSHFFFPNQTHIDNAEVEMLLLPLLNQLEEIYKNDDVQHNRSGDLGIAP